MCYVIEVDRGYRRLKEIDYWIVLCENRRDHFPIEVLVPEYNRKGGVDDVEKWRRGDIRLYALKRSDWDESIVGPIDFNLLIRNFCNCLKYLQSLADLFREIGHIQHAWIHCREREIV